MAEVGPDFKWKKARYVKLKIQYDRGKVNINRVFL